MIIVIDNFLSIICLMPFKAIFYLLKKGLMSDHKFTAYEKITFINIIIVAVPLLIF